MSGTIDEGRSLGRGNVKKWFDARNHYTLGEKTAVKEILENMGVLVKFYPKHIEKEDKHFFLPVMDYLSDKEKDVMLKEFYEFDRKFIHEKYSEIVSDLENERR